MATNSLRILLSKSQLKKTKILKTGMAL
jgi:hypothetical protein